MSVRRLLGCAAVAAMAIALAPGARAEPTELTCKGDSYVFIGEAWQKLDNMSVRLVMDLETGRLVEYALARELDQFVQNKTEQWVSFARRLAYSTTQTVRETIQINRVSGRILHILTDEVNGQKQTVFLGKCQRGRKIF
ncbi:MAG: hypothetical protein WD673_02050 [Alphaproteobacteria bacterium]